MRDLRSSGKTQRTVRARLVKREALIGCVGAADMLFGQEAVGAAADNFGDGLERRCRRQPFWHYGGDIISGSRHGLRQMRKRPFEAEPHSAIVGRRQLFGYGHQGFGKADALCEAADAGDGVARQHRLLVVKAQPLAQCQSPSQAILFDPMALDHLRLGRPIRVDAVERIEDEIGMRASRAVAGDDRIEHAEIQCWNENQLVALLRPSDPRRG